MSTALVVSGIVALVLLIGLLYLVAVRVLHSLEEAFRTINRLIAQQTMASQASAETQRGLVDRVMSQDWQAVRNFEAAEATDEGGFFSPDDQREDDDDAEVYVQTRGWGHMSPMRDHFENTPEEEELLREDFPDEAVTRP